jgi:uncharacterized protein (DUF58 family)
MPGNKNKRIIFGQSRAGKAIRDFYLYRLTHLGKHLLIFSLLTPVFGVFAASTFTLLYVLIAFSFLTIILDPILSKAFLPALNVKTSISTRAAAGAVVPQEITVENRTWRNAHLVYLRNDKLPDRVTPTDEQGVLLPVLKKNDSVKFRMNLEFSRRGEYKLDSVRVESSFPLGLLRSGYGVKNEVRLFIYPHFKPLSELSIPAGKKLQPGGIALASKLGESTEFLGTREFREGDDPRFIHWRSWGRLIQACR